MGDRPIGAIIGHRNIVTLPPDTTVRAAAKVMSQHRIGAVPVTQAGRLLGIFTERDLMNRVIAIEADADQTRLVDVMTADPKTVDVGDSAAAALALMLDGGFRHLPVTKAGTLVGIVSIRDIPPEVWSANNSSAIG